MTPAILASLRAGLVPGDALPDLLDGWQGPAERWWGGAWRPVTLLPPDPRDPYRVYEVRSRFFMDDAARQWTCGIILPGSLSGFRLPLSRPEVRQRVATVMGAGLRCPTPDYCGCEDGGQPVGHRSLRRRPPAPARPLLPVSELGDFDGAAQESAGLLACHVAIVLNGGAGLLGIVPGWTEHSTHRPGDPPHTSNLRYRLRPYNARGVGRCCARVGISNGAHSAGWRVEVDGRTVAHGPETGPEGMAAADRAALLAGFALHNADGTMVLPWPVAAG